MVEAVTTFIRLTGYPLLDYLTDVAEFLASGYLPIRAYYAGTSAPDPAAFRTLVRLRAQARRIEELHRRHRAAFRTTDDWHLLQQLEDAAHRLATIAQLGKYLRSNRTLTGDYRAGTPVRLAPGPGTLEDVARTLLAEDPDQWMQIALDNDLHEEDYTYAGRRPLNLTLPQAAGRQQRDVLGSAEGARALGRDLPHRLQLDGVDQDLYVNTPVETANEAIDRLTSLRCGDIPELPDLGPRMEQLVGAAANLLGLPSVLRQLAQVLATDDTLTGYQVGGVTRVDDQLQLPCTISTVYQPPRPVTITLA